MTAPHPNAADIREALIRARTERHHGETMEEALIRELAVRGLVIAEASVIASPVLIENGRRNPN